MTVNFDSLGIFMDRLPAMAGTYTGLCVVVAGARCVWDDIDKAGFKLNHDPQKHIMCVNDMIMHYPGAVEHAYSNNHQYIEKWCEARRDSYIVKWEKVKHTHSNLVGAKNTWPWPGHGTSTLNAVYTALALGYNEVWLCGAPLDNTGHYFEPPWIGSTFEQQVAVNDVSGGLKYWSNAAKNIFQGRVKSLSGRTRDLLGGPDGR